MRQKEFLGEVRSDHGQILHNPSLIFWTVYVVLLYNDTLNGVNSIIFCLNQSQQWLGPKLPVISKWIVYLKMFVPCFIWCMNSAKLQLKELTEILVIVKNSSPQPTVGFLLADCWPSVCRLPTVGRQVLAHLSTDSWPTDGDMC